MNTQLISQDVSVGFGISFTPGSFESSTQTYKISEDKMVEKIINYFLQQQKALVSSTTSVNNVHFESLQEDATVYMVNSSSVEYEGFVSSCCVSSLNFDVVKKWFSGYGRKEIIQVMLIYTKLLATDPQQDKDKLLQHIIELRNKGQKLKQIAEKYKIDYINEVWLPSKSIYDKILKDQD